MGDTDSAQFQNYIKLQYILSTTATTCLRDIFVREWKFHTNKTWQNTPSDGIFFIRNHGRGVYKQCQKLQQELLSSGNLDRWDIPLLSQAIKIFTSTISNLSTAERNNGLDILKQERNKLAHRGGTLVPDDQFRKIWKAVGGVLLKFGVPVTTLSDTLTVLNRSVQKDKPNPEISVPKVDPNFVNAMKLKEAGNLFFKGNKFGEAISKYSEAIKLPGLPFQDLAAIYSNRSIAYLRVDDFEAAKSDAKGVVLVHPTWSKGYFRLAAAYEALSKFPLALKNYELAIGLDKGNDELKNCLERIKCIIAKRSRDEHLDPLSINTTTEDCASMMNQMGLTTSSHKILNLQRLSASKGNSVGICAEGHYFALGNGRKQDFEQAAKCYAQAASKGSAEGLYNLALLTIEGKGVRSNHVEAVRLLREAAAQETTVTLFGQKLRNLGKAEAEHSLGLWYETGVGVVQNLRRAVKYYEIAIKHGVGSSCNNLALMYSRGEGVPLNFQMAIDLWKLGTYYHCPRATENLALHYLQFADREKGWKWFDFAIAEGSTSLVLRRLDFVTLMGPNRNPPFDAEHFKLEVERDVLNGLVKDMVCPAEEMMQGLAVKAETARKSMIPQQFNLGDEYRVTIKLSHRKGFQETAQNVKLGVKYSTTAGSVASTGITDLFGLQPIFIEDMVATEDHVYEGFVIKFTITEDAITGRPSIPLIVEDEKGSAQRVFVYNYPQNHEKLQESLGFGCKISIVNPYFRVAVDGLAAIRVDDPSTMFFHKHLREMSRCRFCGKGGSTIKCRKCKRCFYCSKDCLGADANFLGHEYICKKRIQEFNILFLILKCALDLSGNN